MTKDPKATKSNFAFPVLLTKNGPLGTPNQSNSELYDWQCNGQLFTLGQEMASMKSLVTKQQSQISHQKTEIGHLQAKHQKQMSQLQADHQKSLSKLQAQLQNLKNQQHEREKFPCECYQHNILDQPSRAASTHARSHSQYRADYMPGLKGTHSDWKGPGWYRFKGPNFTRMAVKSQVKGNYYCSAFSPGFLPNKAYDGIKVGGKKRNVRIHFLQRHYGCRVDTQITRCPGNFYVFWLPQPFVGNRAYCGA